MCKLMVWVLDKWTFVSPTCNKKRPRIVWADPWMPHDCTMGIGEAGSQHDVAGRR